MLDSLKSKIANIGDKGKDKEVIPSRLSVLLQDEPGLDDSDLLDATSKWIESDTKHDIKPVIETDKLQPETSIPRTRDVGLQNESSITSESVNKLKKIISISNLNQNDLDELHEESLKVKPDLLIETLEYLPESDFKNELVSKHLNKYIPSEIKKDMEYIENHLPKSEFDDTDYVEGLLKGVIKHTHETIKHSAKESLPLDELKISLKVNTEMDKWIQKIHNEINKFN